MKTGIKVTKERPCRHCGKPDWCLYFENGVELCNRDQVADGWEVSSKKTVDGHPYLYKKQEKLPKPQRLKTEKWTYHDRQGKPIARYCRMYFDDGSSKKWSEYWDGKRWIKKGDHIKREDIPVYRYADIQKAIANGKQIFWVEGEKCADILWKIGIPATTSMGGSGRLKESDLDDLEGASLVICPDRDLPGIKYAEKVYLYYPHSNWLYAFPESPTWGKTTLPPSDGADIWDWISEKKLTAENIYDAVEIYRGSFLPDKKDLEAPSAEQHYTEKAVDALYSDGDYISCQGEFFKFTGKCYEILSPYKEQRRIADWCRSNPVHVSGDRWKFAHASKAHVNNIWEWVLVRFGTDPLDLNPPGLNLANGVLEIKMDKKQVEINLKPHSPKHLYTYCIEAKYEPKANPQYADQLLSCLDEAQRNILLRTLGASLDLKTVRKFRGREVKSLLLHGEGNNGKDSLREAAQILLGDSMASVSVSDFQAYDQGRKFPLAKLANCRLSWSSENTKFGSIENLQSLKAAITGDIIDIERKNQPEYQIQPETVFLFNCNEPPSLVGGSEAIQSRWGILQFTKTYKKDANPEVGEIEADSRFRYDADFLKEQVVPAFLNKILAQLPLLLKEGIDYSSTKEAFKEIQQESNHLWGFVRDMGIEANPKGKIFIKDLWADLKQWYVETGTIEITHDENGKERITWHDQTNNYDKTVKGANQIYKRFLQLFPKIKKMRETSYHYRTGQAYLSGIVKTASVASVSLPVRDTASVTASVTEAVTEATTTAYCYTEATEAVSALQLDDVDFCELALKRFSDLSPELQQNLIKELTNIANHSRGETKSESRKEIRYCRYKGEVFAVAREVDGILFLRESGLTKIVHKVKSSYVQFID